METKFRAFLEGLEMQNVDELMQKTPVELKLVGSVMANRIKDLKLSSSQQADSADGEKNERFCSCCGLADYHSVVCPFHSTRRG